MAADSNGYYFEMFDAALEFHASNLSLNSLTKSPSKTILLQELVTNGEFNETLHKFICFVISDSGRELLVSRQCKMRFQHVKSNIALMKVLIYADSRCKLPETHPDWVAKVMKSWNKNNETVQSGIGIANEEKSSSVIAQQDLLTPTKAKQGHRKSTSEVFDFNDVSFGASPPTHKASRSMNAAEMGALKQLVNENSDRRDRELDSPASNSTTLSYSKTYGNEDMSPMFLKSANTQKKPIALSSNPLLLEPKSFLAQLEEERNSGQDLEKEISELRLNYDETLSEKERAIKQLSGQLEAKESKLAQVVNTARAAEEEKTTLANALAVEKQRNNELAIGQDKEFTLRKKSLLTKASQFSKIKLTKPILKDRCDSIQAINDSKAKLYKSLNLMSAFPFHWENFAASNKALQHSVSLQVSFPPELKNSKSVGWIVNNGCKLSAATAEVSPTARIDHSSQENIHEDIYYTLVLSDLDYVQASKDDNDSVTVGEYVQWLVVNIPAGIGKVDEAESGSVTLLEYIGPAPEHGSGLHRMVFSLYRQRAMFNKSSLDDARRYYASRFFSSYSWIKGRADDIPVALNAFTCEWDQNVDYLHKLRGYVPPASFRSPLC